ncbi:MAG: F0F1 ATP synthase subunit B [Carboxydocellales bacterium]
MEFNVTLFAWSFVNFIALLYILNKVLYKPMLKMLDDRKRTIAESFQQAESTRQEADQVKGQYQAQLTLAKKEAQEIIERATKMGEEMKDDLVKNAKTEADKALKQAQTEIIREKNQAISALRQEVATLAVLAAGKVVGKSISVEDHEKMVKEFVDEVGDLPC